MNQITEHAFILPLMKGEDLFARILNTAKQANWKNASVQGIGAVTDVELAYYDLGKQEYDTKLFSDIYELVSLQGNITQVDNEPFLHLHAAIADEHYHVFGGHLMKARVGVVVELIIQPLASHLQREFNSEIGLKLIHCPMNN